MSKANGRHTGAAQIALDLEDARLRLSRLHKAFDERDHWQEEIRTLTLKLNHAKRKLKEAGWDLATVLNAEKRRRKEE